MTRKLPILVLLAIALAACNAERPADNAQAPATPPVADQPAQDVPPATAPATGPARFDGYGDMRFGMTYAEVKKAWGGELNGKPGAGEICYYLTPKWVKTPAEFAFMIESGKFVRYDVGNDKEVAPGGGKRSMSADEVRKLYPGRIVEQPHKYVEGGKVLRIKADDGSGGVLMFETDAAGKVTEWRVGQPPQVDYVEGCS
ncbi:MAG: lectin [Luteimonas sp.]